MSLFRTREWWSVNFNENELFDGNSLLISTIGNRSYQFIILGNHEGLLRFYNPGCKILDDGTISGSKPSDLLLESQLQFPILMMNMGLFVSGSSEKFLAVLHPRLLCVYAVGVQDSGGEIDVKVTLNLAFQHQLRHSAHSFVHGAFGGVQRRDFICILALDGLLSFYEQESLAFHVNLPDFLLPAPFAYIPQVDAFVFLNGSQELDCYSYEMLASLGHANETNPKKIVKMWSHNIGEYVLDMTTLLTASINLLVLTERSLYNLSEGGTIMFMKRLEYKPVAFSAYVTQDSKNIMILVCTDSNFLNIYENTCLKWCSKIDQVPVCISRVTLEGLKGGLVLVSEDGLVQCIYLGTQPSIYLIPPVQEPDVRLDQAERELKDLQLGVLEGDVLTAVTEEVLNVKLHIQDKLDQNGFVKMCQVSVNLDTTTPLNKVQVLFVVSSPLLAANDSQTVTSCSDHSTVSTFIYLREFGVPSSLELKVVVSYTTNSGGLAVVHRTGQLPPTLVLEGCPPVKEAMYKLTVITNKAVCAMHQVMSEFVVDDTSTNVVGLKYLNSDMSVTIMAAKTSQRYRLQSDYIQAISLVLQLLVERLKKHFHNVLEFNLSYTSPLPLKAYFEHIEIYHGLIQKRRGLQDKLGQMTSQYRTIQKKVLVNLRDVAPKPVSSLHKILRDTHEMVMKGIEELQEMEAGLEAERCSVSALSRLQVALLQLMTLSISYLQQLTIVFQPSMHDTDEQGWLEAQGAAAAIILRTSLAKSSRDQQKASDISLQPVEELSKVFNKFSAIVERATKGTHLLERQEFEHDKEHVRTMPAVKEWGGVNTDVVPTGSKFADVDSPAYPKAAPVVRPLSSAVPSRKLLPLQEEPELKPPTEDYSVQTVATIETKDEPVVEPSTEETIQEVEEVEPKIITSPVEEDAIWDLTMEEMRI